MPERSEAELKAEIAALEEQLKGLNQEAAERQEALDSARSAKSAPPDDDEDDSEEAPETTAAASKKKSRRGGKKKKKKVEEPEELAYCKAEVASCPQNAQCRLDLSRAYEDCGRFREAYAEARAATTFIKTYGRAWKARKRLELLLEAAKIPFDDDDAPFHATPPDAAPAADDGPAAPIASDAADAAAKAAAEKAAGNAHFVAKRHAEAVVHWTFAIDLLKKWDAPVDAKLYSNRAAANLALKKHVCAATDGNLAVDADPAWWKGHWYFGQATLELVKASAAQRGACTSNGERAQEAYRAFVKCAECDSVPANKRAEAATLSCSAAKEAKMRPVDTMGPACIWKPISPAATCSRAPRRAARGMTPVAPGDEPGSPADSLPPRPQTTGRRRAVDDDDASFAQDEDQENDRRMLKALATKRAESAKASGGKRGGPRRLRPMAPILNAAPPHPAAPAKVPPARKPSPPPEKRPPRALRVDDVEGLKTLELKRELDARKLESTGLRSALASRLKAAVLAEGRGDDAPAPPEKKKTGTGDGRFVIRDFQTDVDGDRVAFGHACVWRVDRAEHGSVEYNLSCGRVVGAKIEGGEVFCAAPPLTRGESYEHTFDDVGTYVVTDPAYGLECTVEVYAVTGMKELREKVAREKRVRANEAAAAEERKADAARAEAERLRRLEERQLEEADRAAEAEAERERNDPRLRAEAEERRMSAVYESMALMANRPKPSARERPQTAESPPKRAGAKKFSRLRSMLDEARDAGDFGAVEAAREQPSHLAMPLPGLRKPLYSADRPAPVFGGATPPTLTPQKPTADKPRASAPEPATAEPEPARAAGRAGDEFAREMEAIDRRYDAPARPAPPRQDSNASSFADDSDEDGPAPPPPRRAAPEPEPEPEAPATVSGCHAEMVVHDTTFAPAKARTAPGVEFAVVIDADELGYVEYQFRCDRVLDGTPATRTLAFETDIMCAGDVFTHIFQDEGRYEIYDVDAEDAPGHIRVLERRVRETDTYFSAVAVVHGVELGRPVGDVLAYYAILAPNPSYAALLHNTPSAPETRDRRIQVM
ncbi:hypothetical protein AURANDRAFT_60925 [Aureococcus anophagefferens]|uniref:SAP domain-containing protein n=1 Tax=Aureococcus anophagefferens TaxID=44056 RepID=F0XWT0_AURAN|nr:hypothetical protein AURANDRAFT_60925 [Aureococcus anophagefferens]EGB12916.1 hypothetical protein AURANDRAFT_60925 [Aureococcus anophagefferens]|eukprot:XP_009032536.1 hypothetical protein AURANDRAFT_60925 [Aureococcus anophagefferens]